MLAQHSAINSRAAINQTAVYLHQAGACVDFFGCIPRRSNAADTNDR